MAGTNFRGGVLSRGVPLPSGGLPFTFGKYYFVNADSGKGSDDNNGLRADQAFATVSKAVSTVTSGNYDVIVMSGNTPHTFTAELAVTKSRIHFYGADGGGRHFGPRCRWEMASGGSANSAILTNTGVGNTFTNIKMFNTDTSTSFAVADGGEYSLFTNCEMVNTVNLGTVTDAHLLANGDSCVYRSCSIGSSQDGHEYSAARGNVLFSREIITGKVCRDSTFEDCIFPVQSTNSGASCFLLTGATDVERVLWVKSCTFWGTKKSGTIDRAIQVDTDQTDGDIFCDNDSSVHGITALVDDSLTTVYHGKTGAETDTAMAARLGGA